MVDLEQIVSEPGLDMDRLYQRGIALSSASQKEVFSSPDACPQKQSSAGKYSAKKKCEEITSCLDKYLSSSSKGL